MRALSFIAQFGQNSRSITMNNREHEHQRKNDTRQHEQNESDDNCRADEKSRTQIFPERHVCQSEENAAVSGASCAFRWKAVAPMLRTLQRPGSSAETIGVCLSGSPDSALVDPCNAYFIVATILRPMLVPGPFRGAWDIFTGLGDPSCMSGPSPLSFLA